MEVKECFHAMSKWENCKPSVDPKKKPIYVGYCDYCMTFVYQKATEYSTLSQDNFEQNERNNRMRTISAWFK
ncbi:Hypothetical protein PACV_255 [Pacmanvirus A23]|uniref:Hypothetical protein n=1 Tax=Pacmanvirus A23 TaxID=1932881 RepID=UPI000A093142|nr:Hypothetical protein B9W72_gp253 [Pacmanvirus A23]SIP85970.1 Hypothetical protein PACV_255 [Pacmanvirus A23]